MQLLLTRISKIHVNLMSLNLRHVNLNHTILQHRYLKIPLFLANLPLLQSKYSMSKIDFTMRDPKITVNKNNEKNS